MFFTVLMKSIRNRDKACISLHTCPKKIFNVTQKLRFLFDTIFVEKGERDRWFLHGAYEKIERYLLKRHLRQENKYSKYFDRIDELRKYYQIFDKRIASRARSSDTKFQENRTLCACSSLQMSHCGTCEHRLRTWPANFHFCLECSFKCRTVRWLQSSGYRGPPSLERQAFFSTIPGSLLLPPKRLSPRCRGSLKIHEPFLDDRPINAFLRRSRWYPNSSIWSYNSFEVLARSTANSINQIACNIIYFCYLVNLTIDRWLLSWSIRWSIWIEIPFLSSIGKGGFI